MTKERIEQILDETGLREIGELCNLALYALEMKTPTGHLGDYHSKCPLCGGSGVVARPDHTRKQSPQPHAAGDGEGDDT